MRSLVDILTKYPSCVQKSLTNIPNGDSPEESTCSTAESSHRVVSTGQLEIFSWQEAAKLRVVLGRVQKTMVRKIVP